MTDERWPPGPWLRPEAGLRDMDETELSDGLVRVVLSAVTGRVPGAGKCAGSSLARRSYPMVTWRRAPSTGLRRVSHPALLTT